MVLRMKLRALILMIILSVTLFCTYISAEVIDTFYLWNSITWDCTSEEILSRCNYEGWVDTYTSEDGTPSMRIAPTDSFYRYMSNIIGKEKAKLASYTVYNSDKSSKKLRSAGTSLLCDRSETEDLFQYVNDRIVAFYKSEPLDEKYGYSVYYLDSRNTILAVVLVEDQLQGNSASSVYIGYFSPEAFA